MSINKRRKYKKARKKIEKTGRPRGWGDQDKETQLCKHTTSVLLRIFLVEYLRSCYASVCLFISSTSCEIYATRSTICLNISDPNSRNKSGFRCHQAGSSKKTQSDKKQTTATSNVSTVAANLIVLLPNERKRARWRPKRCSLARMSAQKKKVKAAATKQQQQTVNVTGVQRKRRCRRRDVV